MRAINRDAPAALEEHDDEIRTSIARLDDVACRFGVALHRTAAQGRLQLRERRVRLGTQRIRVRVESEQCDGDDQYAEDDADLHGRKGDEPAPKARDHAGSARKV